MNNLFDILLFLFTYFVQSKNLHDLFTLGDNQNKSETSDIFANLNPDVKPDEEHEEREERKDRKGKNKKVKDEPEEEEDDLNKKKRDGIKTKLFYCVWYYFY